jgi:ankyrin repeat protein
MVTRPEREMLADTLIFAVKTDDASKVAAALDKGANPNVSDIDGTSPLEAAFEQLLVPSPEVLKLLLDAGADPNKGWEYNKTKSSSFFDLVQSSCRSDMSPRRFEMCLKDIRLMLQHGADPNLVKGFWKCSPLGFAATFGHNLAIVKILVEEGGGIVTDDLIESAKGHPEIQAYLKSKKEQGK